MSALDDLKIGDIFTVSHAIEVDILLNISIQQNTRIAELEDALQEIKQWGEAYPLEVFPEPDFVKARELLKAGGQTLDAISAHNMRHVVTRVSEIARKALDEGKEPK